VIIAECSEKKISQDDWQLKSTSEISINNHEPISQTISNHSLFVRPVKHCLNTCWHFLFYLSYETFTTFSQYTNEVIEIISQNDLCTCLLHDGLSYIIWDWLEMIVDLCIWFKRYEMCFLYHIFVFSLNLLTNTILCLNRFFSAYQKENKIDAN
jgi:hypothetical protein